jgi:alpha-ketoglutarate-dependent taurine dioxygenase
MTHSALRIEPVDATFGAVVHSLELRSLGDEAFDSLYEAWLQHGLLIFPAQFLSRQEQDALAMRFGDLEFEAAPVTNIAEDGTLLSDPDLDSVRSLLGTHSWHHDSTFLPVQAKGAVFTAEIVPVSGADTRWADMAAAYDALDEETRTLVDGGTASHSLRYSMGRKGLLPSQTNADGGYDSYGYHDGELPVRALVKTHPETGRRNLIIGTHAHGVSGMDATTSEQFVDQLTEDACQPPRVYQHQWTAGEACVWDNRRLMHQGVPYDLTQARRMWHSRIAGDPVTELALNYTHAPKPEPGAPFGA